MSFQTKPTFRHRHNMRGETDSICCECVLTVASAIDEHQLTSSEEAHVCHPFRGLELNPDQLGRWLTSASHHAR